MTTFGKWHALELALCLAVMLHLLLFMAVRSPNPDSLSGALAPPETRYLGTSSDPSLISSGGNARTVWSPVMFSLPSEMGFSRDLLQDNLRTRLTFSQASAAEMFLQVVFAAGGDETQIIPHELMVTDEAGIKPQLPSEDFPVEGKRLPANRVYVAPELKERLVGGIVLPPALNKPTPTPWEVSADISVSRQGLVRHVLLNRPLESTRLNQEVIQLLYGLRFVTEDHPVEGRIEIYSSERLPAGEIKP